ncbi:MAG: hypothetical protein M3250_03430 [Thermoproteota archaeon]|jgi:hypothetical protein|nr:hypothetical protein [Thermoproteota archaeon]
MTNILKKESPIEENTKIVKEERIREEIKSQDEFYSLIDKAYYVDELHYKIGT